jgi:hypothetical protein
MAVTMPPVRTRRSFLQLTGAGAISLACSRRAEPPRRDALVQAIAGAAPKEALVHAARSVRAGASVDDLLAAACLAVLTTGGDVGDVHAILVLPSIRQLVAPESGDARWLPVLWAAQNAAAWCGRSAPLDRGATPFTRDGFAGALAHGDAPRAEAHFRSLLRTGRETVELLVEATRPRADPHAAIYAAQAVRFLPLLDAHGAELLLCSVVRYLARSPLRPHTDAPPRDAHALATIATEARLADDAVSGDGVHRTTLLDALLFACAMLPPPERDLAWANASRWFVPSRPRPPIDALRTQLDEAKRLVADPSFRREQRARALHYATGEHDFKYVAAVESVAEHLPREARSDWLATLALAPTAATTTRWRDAEAAAALLAR